MPPKVIEQEHSDLSHRNRENQKPESQDNLPLPSSPITRPPSKLVPTNDDSATEDDEDDRRTAPQASSSTSAQKPKSVNLPSSTAPVPKSNPKLAKKHDRMLMSSGDESPSPSGSALSNRSVGWLHLLVKPGELPRRAVGNNPQVWDALYLDLCGWDLVMATQGVWIGPKRV